MSSLGCPEQKSFNDNILNNGMALFRAMFCCGLCGVFGSGFWVHAFSYEEAMGKDCASNTMSEAATVNGSQRGC